MTLRRLIIGSKEIGDDLPCFITFEAGPTHNGLESAKALASLAAESGADAVKFQIFDANKLVQDKEQLFSYTVLQDKATGKTKKISEPLYDILKRRCLERHEWHLLKEHCDALGLAFFATIGFEEDLDLLREINCDSVKIASADVNHFPLLRLAARSGLNVQLDTGSAELSEIVQAVNVLESEGCNSIIIHQCPSGYPARLPSICLNMIQTLRNTFPSYPIAYSDHTPEADMDIAAVALGANLIEKTITFDSATPSVEHIFSLEPQDCDRFISRIRDVETALGQPNRFLSLTEKKSRLEIRRTPYTLKAEKAGTPLSQIQVVFRRPSIGISPIEYEELLNTRHLVEDLDPDQPITLASLGES